MGVIRQRIQLPELKSTEDVQLARAEGRSLRIGILLFVTIIVLVFVFGVYVNSKYVELGRMVDLPVNDTLAGAHWRVSAVTPQANDQFDLKLMSSIGNIREYKSVRGYGISNAGNQLALTSTDGIEIVNLTDDTKQTLTVPFAYTGESGPNLTWSHDDSYFAFAAYDVNGKIGNLITVNTSTNEVKNFPIDLTYNDTFAMYPVQFSPAENLILARMYDPDVDASMQPSARTVTLAILNLSGKKVWEQDVRGATTDTNSEVIYQWSVNGKLVQYATINKAQPLNYANENLFTQVEFELEM